MDWPELLRAVSDHLIEIAPDYRLELLVDADVLAELDEDEPIDRTGFYLGTPGASEEAIAAAEARLGRELPDDYKAFLRASNGFTNICNFPTGIVGFDPVEEIVWFRDDRNRRLEICRRDFKTRPGDASQDDIDRFEQALLIGKGDGNECLFLVPDGSSTWELWCYHPEWDLRSFGSLRSRFEEGLDWIC